MHIFLVVLLSIAGASPGGGDSPLQPLQIVKPTPRSPVFCRDVLTPISVSDLEFILHAITQKKLAQVNGDLLSRVERHLKIPEGDLVRNPQHYADQVFKGYQDRISGSLTEAQKKQDALDLNRNYGVEVLPRHRSDSMHPDALELKRRADQEPYFSDFSTGRVSKDKQPTGHFAFQEFLNKFRLLAPSHAQMERAVFFQSGSDAVLHTLTYLSQKTFGRVAFFTRSFGSSRGINLTDLEMAESMVGPYVVDEHTLTPEELKKVKKLEDSVLRRLETQITGGLLGPVLFHRKRVRAVFFEPILGANGVLMLRKDFVRRLRALCDRYGVLIVADEVLTGGGRTGKFFGYQHYEGFEPDLIIIGKMFHFSAVIPVQRNHVQGLPSYGRSIGESLANWRPTIRVSSDALLRGARILDIIHSEGLMENVAKQGKAIVDGLNSVSFSSVPAHGIGLLIQYPGFTNAEAIQRSVDEFQNRNHSYQVERLMPHFEIDDQDVKWIIEHFGAIYAPLR